MSAAPRICIVTPGYIASTPRVVKEADALWEAGYVVRVVFSQGNLEQVRAHDMALLATKPWRWAAVGWSPQRDGERLLYHLSRLRHQAARRLPVPLIHQAGLAAHAEGRVYPELARLAAAEPAELFIGHYPAGLAAAAQAARRWGAKLAYDAEDLHTADQPATRAGARQIERVRSIEARYLPHCASVTAASDLIAEELVQRYAIARPLVIHNVFPWAERAQLDGQRRDRQDERLSLYWYSQVIGAGRGIEDVIRAMGQAGAGIQLHLRGSLSAETEARFSDLAREQGVADALFFHAPVPPTELLSRAVEHDVGLALENSHTLNYTITVTNKFFFYLLAGLALVATNVPGQRAILAQEPEAGLLHDPGDTATLARHLAQLRNDRDLLQRCQAAALRAARERWNWEQESQNLIRHLAKTAVGGR